MVPFSFPQPLIKSQVMKIQLLLSSPVTGAKPSPPKPCAKEESPPDTFPPNWVQRHAGLVGQSCRFAPIKKPPYLSMLPSKNLHEPNLFPGTHTAHGILHFLSLPIRG